MANEFTFSDILALDVVDTENNSFIVDKAKNVITYIGDNAVDFGLYHFDIVAGTAKEVKFNFALAHVEIDAFRDAVFECFYKAEKNDIAERFDGFPAEYTKQLAEQAKIDKATKVNIAQVQHTIDVVNARIALVNRYLSRYTRSIGFGVAVDSIVSVLRKDKMSDALKAHIDAVKNTINDIDNDNANSADNDNPANISKLRVALDNLTKAIWQENSNDGIMQYVFHANKTIALDVYKVVYAGRKINDKAHIVKSSKYSLAIRETVFAMLSKCAKDYNTTNTTNTTTTNTTTTNTTTNTTTTNNDNKKK